MFKDQRKYIRELKDEIEDLEYRIGSIDRNHERDLNRVNADHNVALGDRTRVVEDLTSQLKALKAREVVIGDLLARQQTVEDRESLVAVEVKSLGDVKLAINVARNEGKAQAEARFKEGYADGISDGLRKANELVAGANERVYEIAKSIVAKESPTSPTPIIVTPGSHGGTYLNDCDNTIGKAK